MKHSLKIRKLDYKEISVLSALAYGYVQNESELCPFYFERPDLEGVRRVIEQRKTHPINRAVLSSVLFRQYATLENTEAVNSNIKLLASENTFTVCTAHQPNLFTGPLYFIYKIMHAIVLADYLNDHIPEARFVPVYYMGSEDADINELGNTVVDGKKYEWKTTQQGAVGRMKVDKELLKLIEELSRQIGVLPNGQEWVDILRDAYKENATIATATRQLVHQLFGHYGLIVLDPDDTEIKKQFLPVAEKEILDQFSSHALTETIRDFPAKYKVQTEGREINLFMLVENQRNRISIQGTQLVAGDKEYTTEKLLEELQASPERISPNVVLRPVLQELILPNVVFIGGGGELAYWLELKKVFEKAGVTYPILMLRNSYMLIQNKDAQLLEKMSVEEKSLFKPLHEIEKEFVHCLNDGAFQLNSEKEALKNFYEKLIQKVNHIDSTLAEHSKTLQVQAVKKIEALEKKMIRHGKRMCETDINRLRTLKYRYFPGETGLQERVENISGFYARYGAEFLKMVREGAGTLDMKFTVMDMPEIQNHHQM